MNSIIAIPGAFSLSSEHGRKKELVLGQVVCRIHSLMENADHINDLVVFLEKKHMRSDQHLSEAGSDVLRRLAQLRANS